MNDEALIKRIEDLPAFIKYLSDLWLGIRTPTWRGMQLYEQGIYDIDKYEKELTL